MEELPNGSYVWFCPIGKDYFRQILRTGFINCLGLSAIILLFGRLFYYLRHDLAFFVGAAFIAALIVLVSVLIFVLTFIFTKDLTQRYEMNDSYVKAAFSSTSFYFSKARRIIITYTYLELQGRIAKLRVYIPREHFYFVMSFIQQRIPMGCDIWYE